MEAYLYWCYDPEDLSVYVGCQYSKKCNHKNFGVTYFTSSKKVRPLFKSGKMKGEVLLVITSDNYIFLKTTILDIEDQLIGLFIDALGKEKVHNKYHNGKFVMKGEHLSEETRKKLSLANKGKCKGRKASKETKKKLSELAKQRVGELNSNYGNKWNDEQKKHLSDNKKEYYKTHTPYWKGKCKSEETKKKFSEAAKLRVRELNSNYGNKWNDEQKKHLSDYNTGAHWITNGIENKYITSDKDISIYLESGWRYGQTKNKSLKGTHRPLFVREKISKGHKGKNTWSKDRKWINNNEISKMINSNELDNYLSTGWKLGRLKKSA